MSHPINPTCRATGTHDWHETVSQTYRTCTRSGCRAAQRLVAGTWKPVVSVSPARRTPQDTPAPSRLWEASQWNALTFPYPGYDPAWERHMEQQYHKAVAEEQRYRTQRHQHHHHSMQQSYQEEGGTPCV